VPPPGLRRGIFTVDIHLMLVRNGTGNSSFIIDLKLLQKLVPLFRLEIVGLVKWSLERWTGGGVKTDHHCFVNFDMGGFPAQRYFFSAGADGPLVRFVLDGKN
jgi:hypothetical protein